MNPSWEIIIRVNDITEDEAEALYDTLVSMAWEVHGSELVTEGDVRRVHAEDSA
jgi:hypothetical protein